MPYFDTLFAAADRQLDRVYAGPAWFRANGAEVEIRASVRSHAVGTDGDKTAAETWIGYVVECRCGQITIAGQRVKPLGGEEFAFPLPYGDVKIYVVIVGPNGRTYEPLDTINRKMLVFCKFDREELAP